MTLPKYHSRQKFKKLPTGFNHEDSINFKSNWEYTKTLSTYHFNPYIEEGEGDWVDTLGTFIGDWDKELAQAVDLSENLTWKTLSEKGLHPGFATGKSITISQEEYDKSLRGLDNNPFTQLVLHDDVMKFTTFSNMVNYFCLDKVASRIHIQKPGQSYIMHIDKLWHRCPEDPSRIIRIVINLDQYYQGQLVQYGNFLYQQWTKGQIHTFDIFNVPHCTSNISDQIRPILVITGLQTEATNKILNNMVNYRPNIKI